VRSVPRGGPLIEPHMFMADRSYIAGGVSGHPGGCDSANRHRQVPGWEPPMDVTMFWGRNANERASHEHPRPRSADLDFVDN
jgi:hypothetical protein